MPKIEYAALQTCDPAKLMALESELARALQREAEQKRFEAEEAARKQRKKRKRKQRRSS